MTGTDARNAAFYFPCVRAADPLRESALRAFAPCGIVAGVYRAHRRAARRLEGAGRASTPRSSGVPDLQLNLNDPENGQLNPLGINCLRTFRRQRPRRLGRAHAARRRRPRPTNRSTCRCGALALFLEESLYRGTQWVVFEPNDEPLWAQIRLNVGAFMQSLFRQGAFQGATPRDAYFVKCDRETTTQNDINLGIVNIHRRLRAAQAGRVRRDQDPADRRADPDAKARNTPWHSSASTRSASIRTRTSSSGSSGTAATSPASRKVGALKRTTELVEHREGGDPSSSRKSPGRTKFEAITLERGVTHDTEFEKWANKVWNFGSGLGAEVSLKDFRKDIIIEVYNEAGQLALAYKVYRCWVSEFQALPDLDANAERGRDPDASSSRTKAGSATTTWPSRAEPSFTEPA